MAPPRIPVIDRLRRRYAISDKGCWLWTGSKDRDGYGVLTNGRNKQIRAHRAAYEIFIGKAGNLLVCHRCDEPACINPDHLFLGTASDNNKDRTLKRRSKNVNGEAHKGAKLNADQVRMIRSSSASRTELARKLGVSIDAVSRVALRKSWKHVC